MGGGSPLTRTPPPIFSWEGGKVGIHIWSCGGLSAHTHTPPCFLVGRWEGGNPHLVMWGALLSHAHPPFFLVGRWEGGNPPLVMRMTLLSHAHPPLFSRGKVGRWESTFGHADDSP